MRSVIFVVLSFVKAGIIIYFVSRILRNLFLKGQQSKRKALVQFLTMFGVLIAITFIEFGIAFVIPADN